MKSKFAFVLALVLLGAPSTVLACSCVMRHEVGEPPPHREFRDRDRIFIGNVLEVDRAPDSATRMVVRFVTEASWRGAMPDTVTLRVRLHAPCAHYEAGGRYLVIADVDSASSELVSQPCDDGWLLWYSAALRMQAELGSPIWTAPSVGSRALDERAVRIGDAPRSSSGDTIVFGAPREERVARFEIADRSIVPSPLIGGVRSYDRLVRLPAGLYQFRITWTDGRSYESYLSLRCEERASISVCSAHRYFGGLRTDQR